jgi:hypothetical protein
MNSLNKLLLGAFAAVTMTIVGCGAAQPGNAEPTEQSEQALSQFQSHIEYYSDSNYTNLVGVKITNCNGAHSTWGTTSEYVVGEYDSCKGDISYGCWRVNQQGLTVCDYDYCVNC